MATGLYSGVSGLALGTGLYRGYTGLYGGASGLITGGQSPAMSLNFISSTTLDPRITFSRGTNATLIDSTGTLTYAPSNQLLNSESFTATSWTGVGTSGLSAVVSNATVAPDGTTTADSLVEDALTSDHRINQSGLSGSAGKYAFSVYLKAGTRTFARLQFDGTINAVSSSGGVNVNLLDGSLSTPTTAGNITSATATVTDVGNGWYRVGLLVALSTVYSFTGASVRIFTMQSLTGSTSFLGDGSNIFVWGAQFGAMTYETAPRTYNSTTPKNLLGRTEEFDNAAWNKSFSTITANAIADPNGYLNADKIVEDTTTNEHYVDQPFTAISATTYTYSTYLKAGERSQAVLRFAVGGVFVGGSVQVGFILTGSGSSFSISGSPTAQSITAVGNGWYRCSISALTVAVVAATPSVRIQLYDGTSSTYTGIATYGAYIWGAQLSDSASLDTYVYNPAAAITSAAYYGPRFDYDPVTLAPLGLLIEEARTNLFSYSEDFTKTSWVNIGSPTVTADNTISPSGVLNADLWTRTSTAASYTLEALGKAASALTYTQTFYVKNSVGNYFALAFQASTSRADVTFNLALGTISTPAFVTNAFTNASATIVPAGNGWYRCSLTTTTDTSTVITPVFSFLSANVATNGTDTASNSAGYIWGGQVGLGAFATSYISTVGASATRSADIATMVGNNFSNWYNQTTGTFALSAEASANANAEYLEVCDVSNASNSFYFDNAGGSMRNVVASGGSVVAILNLLAVGTVGVTNKLAGAYAFNDFAASRNGGTVVIDTGGAVPVGVLQMNIGRSVNAVASTYIDGHIKYISYYNTRLPNTQLQVLTL